MKTVLLALIPFVLFSCADEPVAEEKRKKGPETSEKATTGTVISEVRNNVKKGPVASYRVKIDDPLNEWYFSVQLFETAKTFQYELQLEYEEITGTDTLKIPNFGMMPEPVIRKGPEKYAAIIGFLDKDKQFREYKKVYVAGEKLKVTTLRQYGVSAQPKQ